MVKVRITNHLKRYFPGLSLNTDYQVKTVAELISQLEKQHPGIANYIVDEHKRLRKHVNIFVSEEPIQDRVSLQDKLNNEVLIMQALSGG